MQVQIYLEPSDRQILAALLSESGYVPTQLGKALGTYINRLVEIPLYVPNPPLPLNPTKHYSPNNIHVTLPDSCSSIPKLFGLYGTPSNTWNDFVYNFIRGNILPRNSSNLPTINLPRHTSTSPNPNDLPPAYLTPPKGSKHDPNMYTFHATTSITQFDIPLITPIKSPDFYYDTRPYLPTMTANQITLIASSGFSKHIQPRYAWYIQELDRQSKLLTITQSDRFAALELSTQFNIIPPFRSQSENARIILTLESLYHRLLVPKP